MFHRKSAWIIFKIKVMELLVFLGALELADYRDERPYFYSSQIEKIKSVHKLLTEELSVNYTTEELASVLTSAWAH